MSWKKPYNENNHNDDIPVMDIEDHEIQEEDSLKNKRHYKEVFALFEAALGKYPLNWNVNVTQQKCAENLYTERGIKAIENALEFYKENKDKEFCPAITSPYDLDSKWTKLAIFKQKHGS